jgi:hypothetical protein
VGTLFALMRLIGPSRFGAKESGTSRKRDSRLFPRRGVRSSAPVDWCVDPLPILFFRFFRTVGLSSEKLNRDNAPWIVRMVSALPAIRRRRLCRQTVPCVSRRLTGERLERRPALSVRRKDRKRTN